MVKSGMAAAFGAKSLRKPVVLATLAILAAGAAGVVVG
jgi:hypothetical protein